MTAPGRQSRRANRLGRQPLAGPIGEPPGRQPLAGPIGKAPEGEPLAGGQGKRRPDRRTAWASTAGRRAGQSAGGRQPLAGPIGEPPGRQPLAGGRTVGRPDRRTAWGEPLAGGQGKAPEGEPLAGPIGKAPEGEPLAGGRTAWGVNRWPARSAKRRRANRWPEGEPPGVSTAGRPDRQSTGGRTAWGASCRIRAAIADIPPE
jgi:hypothetical protein